MKVPFEQAVASHGPTVLRVCRAVLGVGADAEDAWSDTFLAALRAWPDLEHDTNVEAWLVLVARRKAIDIGRRNTRHARRSADLTDVESIARDADSTGAGVTGAGIAGAGITGAGALDRSGSTGSGWGGDPQDRELDVWAAVARLPQQQRYAIAYHYLGGLPHVETAELIGSTPAAVRRAAADGINRLRRDLGLDSADPRDARRTPARTAKQSALRTKRET